MRVGYSWPAGHGRRMWVSMSLGGWVLMWLVLLPGIILWLVIWVLVQGITLLVRGTGWVVREIRDRPAIPPKLRTPPRRLVRPVCHPGNAPWSVRGGVN